MKKYIVAGLLLSGLICMPCGLADANPLVLGMNEARWQESLESIAGDYEFADDFVERVKKSQQQLENKYGSEHFERLNSKKVSLKDKRRNNSLLHVKPQKARSSFIIDLNLEKKEYNQLLAYIPALGEYYAEQHIAQMLPYIAYCLNYNVKQNELDYYLREFLRRQTPPDIACERLYRLAEKNI